MIIPENSKTIRELLLIETPIQKVIFSLKSPLDGKLIKVVGGSNSGKSFVSLNLMKEFAKNNSCAYYDLERNLRKESINNIKIVHFSEELISNGRYSENIFDEIKKDILSGVKVLAIDYLQLIQAESLTSFLSKLRGFAEKKPGEAPGVQ